MTSIELEYFGGLGDGASFVGVPGSPEGSVLARLYPNSGLSVSTVTAGAFEHLPGNASFWSVEAAEKLAGDQKKRF